MMNRKPEILVLAGPNGSGKSTISKFVKVIGEYYNADEIKKYLHCTDMEAAKKAEQLREDAIVAKKDFTFETVLSTDRNLDLLERAKEIGYFIRCFYVLTNNPKVNVARVRSRVIAGGHDVPVEKIISRYEKCIHCQTDGWKTKGRIIYVCKDRKEMHRELKEWAAKGKLLHSIYTTESEEINGLWEL